ncbi:MAG: hypothetical protein AB7P76_01530 [Candidatus Melainabacteria bacterium]
MADPVFFDYPCDQCGTLFCERVHLMNLALNYIDEEFCLACLAGRHDMTPAAMAEFAWEYVSGRDCFKDPWMQFDAAPCPLRPAGHCHCQYPKPGGDV